MYYKKNLQVKIKVWLLIMLFPAFSFAQQLVTGRVISKSGTTGVAGVTVTINGTSKATSTDADGIFSINANKGDVLVFSSTRLVPVRNKIKSSEALFIEMASDTKSMNEVVVTALGVRKETKRLGYAVQEI